MDDFGLHAGVAEATLRLAALGRISAVSCMPAAPAWAAGVPALAPLRQQRIELGLHLDLTEFPVSPRLRRSLGAWMLRAPLHLVDRDGLRDEIARQLDRFESAAGAAPSYVDGHRHVHQLPVVREVLLELLRTRYAGRLPWLRSTLSGETPPGTKARIVQQLGGRALSRGAQRWGIGQNRRLLGIYDFKGGAARYEHLLAQWLNCAAHGDLLVCHPAAGAPADDPIGSARQAEYQVLAGSAFGELLSMGRVRVDVMGAILREPARTG